MAKGGGHVITLILNYLCKCFRTKHLEARGVEPLFSYAYVHSDPGKDISERIQRESAVMEMPGWRWMLLVLLLGGRHPELTR
jgi:hypothetical protein